MTPFDAWHLPGVKPTDLDILTVGELTCRYPRPDPGFGADAAQALLDAGEVLRRRSVAEIVEVIAAAAGRLADPEDPLRRQADELLPAATGYTPEMTRLIMDRMAADWEAGALRRLLDAELPEAAMLDEFRPVAPGRQARAFGPRLAFHVFAGNVPGVAVTSLARALLAKAPSLGKLASGQPVLPVLFARAAASVDEEVGRALGVTYWPGGDAGAEGPVLERADTVVVYGAQEVLEAYTRRARPGQRLLDHGPRLSVGLVARDAAQRSAETAAEVAEAVAAFDQRGCVSPHAVWVEEGQGSSGVEFAAAVAEALERLESTLPRGRISSAEALAIQSERATAELRGHAAGRGPRVFAGEGTRWTVVWDPDPTFRPSCLNRFLRVHSVDALESVPPRLAGYRDRLQSVALAGGAERRRDLAGVLAEAGATRVTSFSRLPWPPPDWHHDGRSPLGELLRWVDLEDPRTADL